MRKAIFKKKKKKEKRNSASDISHYTSSEYESDATMTSGDGRKDDRPRTTFPLISMNEPSSTIPLLYEGEGMVDRDVEIVYVEDYVTIIPREAFHDCSALTTIKLPTSLTKIGDGAFKFCSSLTTIDLPESLTTIGYGAFDGCSLLTTINLPESLTSIGDRAFSGCSLLTTINLPPSLTKIGDRTFNGCSALTNINLPQSLTTIGKYAFNGCTSLNSITIPSSLTTIDDEAFGRCSALTTINLPESLTSIGGRAFFSCSALTTIKLPSSLTTIGNGAFKFCTSLIAINLPSSLTTIGDGAFRDCTKLTIVEVPNSTEIGGDAFYKCTLLNLQNKTNNFKERFNKLPLHRLCYKDDISLSELKNHFPSNNDNNTYNNNEGVDDWNCTALHILAANPNSTSEMLEFLVSRCTNILDKVDIHGRTFLHYACENYIAFPVSSNLLKLIISVDAHVISKADRYKDNIMTLANRCSMESFFEKKMWLFGVHPVIVDLGKNDCERMSIQELIERRTEYKTEEEDFKQYSDLDQHGLVKYFTDLQDKSTIGKWVEKLKEIQSVETIELISKFTDFYGRTTLSGAPSQIREVIFDKILFLKKYKFAERPLIYQSDTALVLEAFDYKADEYYSKLYYKYEDKKGKCITKDTFTKFMTDLLYDEDENQQDEVFKQWKAANVGQISKTEFISFCKSTFGKQYNVALKFMKEKAHFKRELVVRKELVNDSRFIIQILESYSSEDPIFKENKDKYLQKFHDDISQFDYLIVMPKGHRNLDIIQRCEKPGEDRIKVYAKDICRGILELHNMNSVHGDVKPQNFIRVENRIQMIDFDAFGIIVQNDDKISLNHVGLKFSSGVVPPEMIFEMYENKKDEYLKYFENIKEHDIQIWNRIQPIHDEDEGCYYCVKTFLSNDDGMIQDYRNLPYEPIMANASIDLWSFGVLLYKLISGKSLFDTDKNEDLTTARGFRELCHWDDEQRDKKLYEITDKKARHLLQTLLSTDPKKRESIEFVFQHPYIDPSKELTGEMEKPFKENNEVIKKNLELTKLVKERTVNVLGRIDESKTALCKALFEKAEVDIPTCFFITEDKIVPKPEDKDSKNVCNFKFMEWISEKLHEHEDKKEAIIQFLSNPTEFLGMSIGEKFSGDHYLYFIDEYTHEPVVDTEKENYPFKINILYETEIYPLLLLVMSLLPLSHERLEGIKDGFDKDTTIFDILEDFKTEEKKAVRGSALQKFKAFLVKEDKTDFCGLHRVCDQAGNAIWTSSENAEKIKRHKESVNKISIVEYSQMKENQQSLEQLILELEEKSNLLEQLNLEYEERTNSLEQANKKSLEQEKLDFERNNESLEQAKVELDENKRSMEQLILELEEKSTLLELLNVEFEEKINSLEQAHKKSLEQAKQDSEENIKLLEQANLELEENKRSMEQLNIELEKKTNLLVLANLELEEKTNLLEQANLKLEENRKSLAQVNLELDKDKKPIEQAEPELEENPGIIRRILCVSKKN